MAGNYNAIQRGFPWGQAFAFVAGTFGLGDNVRAEFRYDPEDAQPIFTLTSQAGEIDIDDQTVTLNIPKEKTHLIVVGHGVDTYRLVHTDLVRVPSEGVEEHMGFTIRIPVLDPITKGAS